MASLMPISRVRSVTETSMMFMMPMPPTSRLTPATAESSPVITPVTLVSMEEISLVSITEKLSSSPTLILRRSRSSNSIAALTLSVE